MFNSTNSRPTVLKVAMTATFIAALACAPLAIAQEHEHGDDAAASKEVTGEVVDMMCYVDHNALGEKHGQSCGAKCIKSGGPGGAVGGGRSECVGGGDRIPFKCGGAAGFRGNMPPGPGLLAVERKKPVGWEKTNLSPIIPRHEIAAANLAARFPAAVNSPQIVPCNWETLALEQTAKHDAIAMQHCPRKFFNGSVACRAFRAISGLSRRDLPSQQRPAPCKLDARKICFAPAFSNVPAKRRAFI